MNIALTGDRLSAVLITDTAALLVGMSVYHPRRRITHLPVPSPCQTLRCVLLLHRLLILCPKWEWRSRGGYIYAGRRVRKVCTGSLGSRAGLGSRSVAHVLRNVITSEPITPTIPSFRRVISMLALPSRARQYDHWDWHLVKGFLALHGLFPQFHLEEGYRYIHDLFFRFFSSW
ncbi:hypothetical protein BS47DRAFT_126068 [Hydnum rufescens UP504]|uniref:Uncharacterized protein n=1 Tax=Hydnum rufescens UP504 TaxID=1448309 RepID=A0A9P6B7U1_9AGAM|nr:hypothetical protein BS47DRAFT_126068 [Hydnum rufescens UP504]